MVKAVHEIHTEAASAGVDAKDLEHAQKALVSLGVNLRGLRALLTSDPSVLEEVTSDLYSSLVSEGRMYEAAEFLTLVGEEVARVCSTY